MNAGKKRKKRKSMSDSKDDEESLIDNIDNKRQKTDIKQFFVPVSQITTTKTKESKNEIEETKSNRAKPEEKIISKFDIATRMLKAAAK